MTIGWECVVCGKPLRDPPNIQSVSAYLQSARASVVEVCTECEGTLREWMKLRERRTGEMDRES